MKTMKRILASMVATMMMVAMLVVPASADNVTYDITIKNTSENHTYEAYQIFGGTLASSGILSNIEWGSGIDGDDFMDALKSDESLNTYFSSCTNAANVAEALALQPFTNPNSAELDAFARIAANKLTAPAKTVTSTGPQCVIEGLNPGYYLIKDQYDSDDNELEGEAYTKYMLYVVKNIEISPKAAAPTVSKTVSKLEGSNYGSGASVTISREAYFRLTGTLHDRIGEYDTYKYIFTDTLPNGLDLADRNSDEEIDIWDLTIDIINLGDGTDIEANSDIIKAHVDDECLVFNYNEDNNIFTLEFKDIKDFIYDVTETAAVPGDTIQVTYKTTLNSDATITDGSDAGKEGNENQVTLTYSTDPNLGAVGPTGKTAPAKATVYTYALQVNKVDGTNALLPNATFILYHEPASSSEPTIYGIFEEDEEGVYTLTSFSTNENVATPLTVFSSNDDDPKYGTLLVKGLGAATFKLKETVPPSDEYNLLQTPASVTMPGDLENASTQILNVVNHKGTTLPETGGMGTTVFYIAGGALMIGAAAVLITKKRGARN